MLAEDGCFRAALQSSIVGKVERVNFVKSGEDPYVSWNAPPNAAPTVNLVSTYCLLILWFALARKTGNSDV